MSQSALKEQQVQQDEIVIIDVGDPVRQHNGAWVSKSEAARKR